jgi:hypothetical protein
VNTWSSRVCRDCSTSHLRPPLLHSYRASVHGASTFHAFLPSPYISMCLCNFGRFSEADTMDLQSEIWIKLFWCLQIVPVYAVHPTVTPVWGSWCNCRCILCMQYGYLPKDRQRIYKFCKTLIFMTYHFPLNHSQDVRTSSCRLLS